MNEFEHLLHDGINYYAGNHLHIDMFGAENTNNIIGIEQVMKEAAIVACATILSSHFHHFDGNGVTGILVLSESHFSVHSWPNNQLAVFDIFMCGVANPNLAIPVLEKYFTPSKMIITHYKRGIIT